jgi:transposase
MMESMWKEKRRKRPKRIHADTNYDTPLVRYYLRRRHVIANIPSRARKHRGRPRLFDLEALRRIRYTVERFFSWIKSFRRIDSRYDRLACSFMGFVHVACSLILMRDVLR